MDSQPLRILFRGQIDDEDGRRKRVINKRAHVSLVDFSLLLRQKLPDFHFTAINLAFYITLHTYCGVQNNALGIKHLQSRLGWWNKKLDFMQLSLVMAKYVSNQDKSFSFQIFWYHHKKSPKAFSKSFSWIRWVVQFLEFFGGWFSSTGGLCKGLEKVSFVSSWVTTVFLLSD